MEPEQEETRVVRASREIAAAPEQIFELIADPARQPQWDGNGNLAEAAAGQRVREVGDVFMMTLTNGSVRENHVVEFDEGRRIAWTPAEPGRRPPGHLWRWELEPAGASRTLATCTYDWTRLSDEKRLPVARATTAERLQASLDRLADLAEQGANVALRSPWEVPGGAIRADPARGQAPVGHAMEPGDSGVPVCGSGELSVTLHWEHDGDRLRGEVIAENTGSRTCRLPGKPGIKPLDLDGKPLPVETVITLELRHPGYVILEPGQRARTLT